jgi:hypothetical protein
MLRLFKKANIMDLLDHDILPEKHALLEEALKMPMCPVRPVVQDMLTKQ